MNELNSLLIEGTVVGNCGESTDLDGERSCIFIIENIRTFKRQDELVEDKCRVSVFAGGTLYSHCAEKCTVGRKVRVVGRLSQFTDGSLKIIAEHVEIRQ